jgi:excisionase family DNA binding protein
MNRETFNAALQGKLPSLLQAADVGEVLNMSLTTVYYYARQGVIPSIRIGNKIRFRKSDILKLKSGKK